MPNLHKNYNDNLDNYEITYNYLTSNSKEAKKLRNAFIEKVNPLVLKLISRKISFKQLNNRTSKSIYAHKDLYTTFAPKTINPENQQQQQSVDGLIIFVSHSNELNQLIARVNQIKHERVSLKGDFSIMIVSHNDLENNLNFEELVGIIPSYKKLNPDVDGTLSWEDVQSVIRSMEQETLNKNAPIDNANRRRSFIM